MTWISIVSAHSKASVECMFLHLTISMLGVSPGQEGQEEGLEHQTLLLLQNVLVQEEKCKFSQIAKYHSDHKYL